MDSTVQRPTTPWGAALITIFVAALVAIVALLTLLQLVVTLEVAPDVRDGMPQFFAIVTVLTALVVIASYSAFPICRAIRAGQLMLNAAPASPASDVQFSRAFRWVILPAVIGIPAFVYTLIAVAYVYP
jgi:hypothetical protein